MMMNRTPLVPAVPHAATEPPRQPYATIILADGTVRVFRDILAYTEFVSFAAILMSQGNVVGLEGFHRGGDFAEAFVLGGGVDDRPGRGS